jgi:hypothetical protein
LRRKNRQFALYSSACILFVISFTYLSVPLYRIFCAKTGIGGKGEGKAVDQGKYETRAKPVSGKRVLTVKFNADTSNTMPWKFRPEQHEIKVLPGEAALAFFKAENKSNDDIIGVAVQIHLPTAGALTDLIRAGLAIGGIFSPGLEQGFIPLDGLPSTFQIKLGSLTPSTSTFHFASPAADYTYVSKIALG